MNRSKYVFLFVICLVLNSLKAQDQPVGNASYEWGEIDISVNGYNILTPYTESEFRSKVGADFTKFRDTNDTILLEFDYNIYYYVYGESSIIVDDEWGISDIQVHDQNLSINGIRLGDSIEKAKSAFPKHEVRSDDIILDLDWAVLRFEYDASGVITYIAFLVRT